ncbi:hypothetical protein DYH09_02200 [bacterium CPR1]|nr:hypothetical protein [bacterium CPR1]
MRIDGPSFSLPSRAPGGGPPVDRAELEQTAQRLQEDGYRFQVYKATRWPFSEVRWREVDRQEGLQRLSEDAEVRLVKGEHAHQVLSKSDLIELAAFDSGQVDALPQPKLARAVAALSKQGILSGLSGNLTAYQVYNLLLQDPNHERQEVRFTRQGDSLALNAPNDALTAAWLVAGVGDRADVAPGAAQLQEIKDLGFQVDPFRVFAQRRYGGILPLTMGNQVLASMPLDQLDPHRAGQLCLEWKEAQQALGQDARLCWEALQERAGVPVPFSERLSAMATLKERLGEPSGRELYKAVLGTLKEGERLESRVAQALEVVALAPTHPALAVQVYRGYQRRASYPEVLERTGDLKITDRLVAAVPVEQEHQLLGLLEDLGQLDRPVANELAVTLAEQKVLPEQRSLVAELAGPSSTAREILQARDEVLKGDVQERKQLLQANRAEMSLPSATRLLAACPDPAGIEVYRSLRGAGMEEVQAVALAEAMGRSRREGEKLTDLVGPALELRERAPKSYCDLYPELRKTPGREGAFLSSYQRSQNAREAATVAASLPPEQNTLFFSTYDQLKAAGIKHGPQMLLEAVAKQRLKADSARLERIPTLALYQAMIANAPAGSEDAFLSLAAEPGLNEPVSSWKQVFNGLPEEALERVSLWKAMRVKLGSNAALADRLMVAVPPSAEPDLVLETLGVLLGKAPRSPIKAVEAFEKVYQSKSSELLAHLVRGGANLEEATEMARRVGRNDLPGAQLPQTQRCELVGRLGGLRGGNLQEGFQDYLFLATRLEDSEHIPMAVEFFASLIETGLSPTEARMAYVELERRPELGAHQSTVLKVLRFADGLAGAREILDQVVRLEPEEAATRLEEVLARQDAMQGLAPRLRARLAAGHLASPLSPEGLDQLGSLLGSSLHWAAQPGWTVGGDPPGLRLELPRGASKGGAIESSPFWLASGGESTLSFDYVAGQPARLVALVEGAEKPVVLASLENTGKNLVINLSSLRGKKIRLRLECTRADQPQKLELSRLRLDSTPTAGRTDLTASDFNSSEGQISEPVQLSSKADTQLCASLGGQSVTIEAYNGSSWVRLPLSRPEGGLVKSDLSAYRGKKLHLRFRDNRGYAARPRFVQLREDPGPTTVRPLVGSSPAVAEEIVALSFDSSRTPEQRLSALQGLQLLGDDLEAAWKAWPMLEPHVGSGDFEDRVGAVKALLPDVELLAEVEKELQPGESLTSLARLRKGRSGEDFTCLRERLCWESQEATPASSVDFVGAVQSRSGVESADLAWQAVAPPIHDESLSERRQAYLDLLEGCAGDGKLAHQAYCQLLSWLEPAEGIQRAARAAVELRALVPGAEDWIKLLSELQASQLDGRLQGVMLKRMSTFLIGKVTLEGIELEDALKIMPEELKGKTGIEERDLHLVVGGVRLGKRDG